MRAKKPQLIVITNSDDRDNDHVPFVQKHLDRKLIAIDPIIDTLRGKELTYGFKNGDVTPIYNGTRLNDVTAVWLRRPTLATQELFSQVDPIYEKFSMNSVRLHVRQLYAQFQDALWISDANAIQKAELKTHQIVQAAKADFNIPLTLHTSSPQAAQAFLQKHKRTIIKSSTAEAPVVGDDVLVFFSSVVERGRKVDLSHLKFAPAIFQQAIDVGCELRLTVVGEKVFPAVIGPKNTPGNRGSVRDWRVEAYKNNLSIEAFDDLPKDIRDKCVNLVKNMGLKYGAIDMIVDTRGKYWFLEINPNGLWAFVEEASGLPIGKAIAELMMLAVK